MNKLLILCMLAFVAGCIKAPPPYVAAPDARPELPDGGSEEVDASLPEASDSGIDAGVDGSDTDGGE
mgnify:CR=1 FL=1